MSIDLSALPRRDGVVEGRWAMLMRSPLNHFGAGVHFVGGMHAEPVTGATVERALCAFGPDVLCIVRVDEEARRLVCIPPFDEMHAELVRVLGERRIDFELQAPWDSLMRAHDEMQRSELEERFARAEETIREIAKGHVADYESANAEAAVVFDAFSDRSMLRERLEATYAAEVARLEREGAEREAREAPELPPDEPGPIEPGTIDNPEAAAAAAAAGKIVPLPPEVPAPPPTVDDEAPKKGRKRKS